MAEFNPMRLVLARHRRKLSQSELADLARVSRRALVKFEREGGEPGEVATERLATALRFPKSFFYQGDPPELSPAAASFRALTHTSVRDRNCALACGALAIELHGWIKGHFKIPDPDLPRLALVKPENGARELRECWRLGERPIGNLVHLLESKGVRIFSLSDISQSVDAFSFWYEGTPFIMLNTLKSTEHARFDLGHELGHLILHRHGRAQGVDIEQEAHSFASSWLMPSGDVMGHAPRNATIHALLRLKSRWGVSLIALVHRLAALRMLTEWKVRHLYIEIAKRGYRTKEPNPMLRESSQLLSKVLSFVRGSTGGLRRVSVELSLLMSELDALAFGLATVSVQGGRIGASLGRPTNAAPLRVVQSQPA
jgi:Zn-dependent peptidase ImmA (M78 family)/DNA-binding XRE family transcriptional regulator